MLKLMVELREVWGFTRATSSCLSSAWITRELLELGILMRFYFTMNKLNALFALRLSLLSFVVMNIAFDSQIDAWGALRSFLPWGIKKAYSTSV